MGTGPLVAGLADDGDAATPYNHVVIRSVAIAMVLLVACGKSDEKPTKLDEPDGKPTRKPARPANESPDPDTLLAIKQPIEATAMAMLASGNAASGMSKGVVDPAVAAIAGKVKSIELVTIGVSFYWFPEQGPEVQSDFDLLLGTSVRIVGLATPENDRAWHRIGTSASGLQPLSKGFAHVARASENAIRDGGCVRPELADPSTLPAPLKAELDAQLAAAKRDAPALCDRVRGLLTKSFISKQVVPRRVRFVAKDAAGGVVDVVVGTLTQRRSDGSPLELSLDRVVGSGP